MDTVLFWLLVVALLVAALFWTLRGLRDRREAPLPTPSQPASRIRVVRTPTPRPEGTRTPTRVRVLNRANTHTSKKTQPALSADIPPSHALCTHCQRPFSADTAERERYGGEYRCSKCGAYSHGNCYRNKGRRCGGICAL